MVGLSTSENDMRITWNELTVNFENPGADDLLRDWRWLVGESIHLLPVSAMGDMFWPTPVDVCCGSIQALANWSRLLQA
jgi:hypothetical protein